MLWDSCPLKPTLCLSAVIPHEFNAVVPWRRELPAFHHLESEVLSPSAQRTVQKGWWLPSEFHPSLSGYLLTAATVVSSWCFKLLHNNHQTVTGLINSRFYTAWVTVHLFCGLALSHFLKTHSFPGYSSAEFRLNFPSLSLKFYKSTLLSRADRCR